MSLKKHPQDNVNLQLQKKLILSCTNLGERQKTKLHVKLQTGWRGKKKENAWQIHIKCPRQLLSAQKWFYGILCRKRNKKIKELGSKDQVAFSLISDL